MLAAKSGAQGSNKDRTQSLTQLRERLEGRSPFAAAMLLVPTFLTHPFLGGKDDLITLRSLGRATSLIFEPKASGSYFS